jgi:hypothetical protein
MKIQKTKDLGFRTKKKPFFTIGHSNPLRGQTHLGSGSTKKMFFQILFFDSCRPGKFLSSRKSA